MMASSVSKGQKRSLNAMMSMQNSGSGADRNEPLPKRARVKPVTPSEMDISSNLFLNHLDHQQFESIFHAVQQCTDLSPLIDKQIAEFATGFVKSCANKSCDGEIFVFPQQLRIQPAVNSMHTEFRHCRKTDRFWCAACKERVVSCLGCELKDCTCQCGQLYFEPDYPKCPGCEFLIIGDCRTCYREACGGCHRRWCSECSFQMADYRECQRCCAEVLCCAFCVELNAENKTVEFGIKVDDFQCTQCLDADHDEDELEQSGQCPICKQEVDEHLEKHFEDCLDAQSDDEESAGNEGEEEDKDLQLFQYFDSLIERADQLAQSLSNASNTH